MNTRKTLAVLCFGAVLALAGCGESGSKSEPDTASSSEAAASYEETASSEAEASSEAADESTVQQPSDESSEQQPSADDSAAEQPSEGIMTDAGIEVSIEGGYIGTEYRKLKESGDDHLSAKTYYDAEGKAVLEVGYKSEEYHSYKTYKYDDEGRLIEEFYHDEYTDKPDTLSVYEYGEFGLVRKNDTYQPSGIVSCDTKYEYDENGRLKYEAEYGNNEKLNFYYKFEYSDDGSYTRYTYNGETDEVTGTYFRYDADGDLTEIYRPKTSLSNQEGEKYEYNEDKNVTKIDYYEKEKNVSSTFFEYDDQGRLIHSWFEKNGKVSMERRIEFENV